MPSSDRSASDHSPSLSSARRALVVGAGLGGALMAGLLARRGWRVSVFERRPDPRLHGFAGGRSINLALSARGIAGLERLGVADRVLADVIPMRGRMMHAVDGSLTFQPYSKERDRAINSVSRSGLNLVLLESLADRPGVELRFSHRALDVDLDRPAVRFLDEDADAEIEAQADLVIGADGAFSAIRQRMQKQPRFDYSQSYLEHGYRELSIPPTSEGEFALDPHALHIWPRGGFMMIALPNPDRSFTCTLFWPFADAKVSFEAVRTPKEIRTTFAREFPDAMPLMPDLVEEYQRNPVGSMVTIRCGPWTHAGRVALIGDAAHAIVPFYGQGMNAAFEDGVVLDECLERHGDADLGAALADYDARRKANADAIADMALTNFIEMRDRVASKRFLLRKKFEKLLHRLLPAWYVPLYDMVSFSTIPYAEARARARRQHRIVALGLGLGFAAAAVAAITIAIALAATGTGVDRGSGSGGGGDGDAAQRAPTTQDAGAGAAADASASSRAEQGVSRIP